MPLFETPRFNPTSYSMLDIAEPGKGGINNFELEFEQEVNQSPYVQNMLYRNGAFGKRYGLRHSEEFTDTIYDVGLYNGHMLVHSGTKIYLDDEETEIASGLPESEGLWFNFNRILYYLNGAYYQYNGTWSTVTPYAPEIVINRKPDGSYSDPIENYNRVGNAFKNTFHGDGTSKTYVLTDKNLDNITPKAEVDNVETNAFTWDKVNGTVTFTNAPAVGTNNVVITAYKTEQEYIDTILHNKYSASYGGNLNSRIFLAGGGNSTIYYSEVFDATYFPESNYHIIGNSNDDVTGFGEQYDILLVFKPTEIYSLDYYVGDEGTGEFTCKQVNPTIGCDCPHTIQLVNNQLVWLSTIDGVCTLVSTNIEDERNVRPLSRNINGGHIRLGLLQEHDLEKARSVDWDGKYFLSVNGICYVWDYLMSPYLNTGKIDQDAKRLSWFFFTNWSVDQYLKVKTELYMVSGSYINTTQEAFNDFGLSIDAKYHCPLYQFNAVPWLKTVKNIYVQCREDHDSTINMHYVTEDDQEGEAEPEPIKTYASVRLWNNFDWDTFQWDIYGLGRTHRRKCNLKKIQMATVVFTNNEVNEDMSITHVAFQYAVIKNVK